MVCIVPASKSSRPNVTEDNSIVSTDLGNLIIPFVILYSNYFFRYSLIVNLPVYVRDTSWH